VVTERPRLISLLFEPVRRLLGESGSGIDSDPPAAATPPATSSTPEPRTAFDGGRAFVHVEALAALGPRSCGTAALTDARSYVAEQLRAAGWRVDEEELRASTPAGEQAFCNLTARLSGDATGPVILLATHLDTKRLEGVAAFQGANEGASGAAVLLECARVFADVDTPVPVRIAFFDGKEAWGRSGPRDGLYGSRAVAERMAAEDTVRAVIVCDMVGDCALRFTDELRSTGWLADALVEAGRRLGYAEYFERARADAIPVAVRNDHIPFLRLGLPAALLCDYDFGGPDPVRRTGRNRFWRTGEDRVERVCAGSLQVTGDVLVETVLRLDEIAAAGGRVLR